MAQTGFPAYSKTAASNATADSAQNWAEGMAPSAVNDSARGGMASMAKWRDDTNGSIATTGTSTAYAITTNTGMDAFAADYVVAFQIDEDCGTPVTLNVDSKGAKPLRSAPNVELVAGALKAGGIYSATYKTSNSGEWILQNVTPTILADSQVATAKIADAAVTNAKLANMANATVKGRATSGSGASEDLTLSQVLDFVGSASQGDILIRGASSWSRLAVGAAGTFLSSDGTSPSWGVTSYQKISTITASSSASVAFTGIDSTYRELVFEFDSVLPATDDSYLIAELSTDNGSNWITTSYISGVLVSDYSSGLTAISSATTSLLLTQPAGGGAGLDNGTGNGYSGLATLRTPASSSVKKMFSARGCGLLANGSTLRGWISDCFWNGGNTAVNAIRFRFSSGNIASGVVTMYGIK